MVSTAPAESQAQAKPPLISLADDLHKLCLKWEAANKARQLARMRCEPNADALLQAEWDAMGDAEECRAAIATTFTFMLKVAIDHHPDAVAELLTEALARTLGLEI